MIIATGKIIIITMIDEIAMTNMIAVIALNAVTALATRTRDSMGITVIARSLPTISKRVMIATTIKKQSIMSCTLMLAPKAPFHLL